MREETLSQKMALVAGMSQNCLLNSLITFASLTAREVGARGANLKPENEDGSANLTQVSVTALGPPPRPCSCQAVVSGDLASPRSFLGAAATTCHPSAAA